MILIFRIYCLCILDGRLTFQNINILLVWQIKKNPWMIGPLLWLALSCICFLYVRELWCKLWQSYICCCSSNYLKIIILSWQNCNIDLRILQYKAELSVFFLACRDQALFKIVCYFLWKIILSERSKSQCLGMFLGLYF